MSTHPLTPLEKELLESAVGPDYHVIWIEGWEKKWRMAKLLFRNAKIRLTIPEAYEVHKQIIEWGAQFSTNRIPDQAVGLDPVALKLMKWAMRSWDRVRMLNRYLAGTWMPRIQLDLIPALRCGAHFVIVSNDPPTSIDDYLGGGRAVQRFWLTATKLDLQFQPEMTPLIFSQYVDNSMIFTRNPTATRLAAELSRQLQTLVGAEAVRQGVFVGRLGRGCVPKSRSTRKPISELVAEDGV